MIIISIKIVYNDSLLNSFNKSLNKSLRTENFLCESTHKVVFYISHPCLIIDQ